MPIRFKSLSYIYDEGMPYAHTALDNINLDIKEGKITAIIGETGSGKSTLVEHLNALLIPSNGSLEVNEEQLSTSLKTEVTNEDISSIKDFTKSAYRKISHVQLNPMDYVDKRIVAYKNPYKTHFANPYITSAYSGMLFNSYM